MNQTRFSFHYSYALMLRFSTIKSDLHGWMTNKRLRCWKAGTKNEENVEKFETNKHLKNMKIWFLIR